MPVIDPDGLFSGDRFDLMSDEARTMWPYFWVASNSVGRLEINYNKFSSRAWSRFRQPPSEDKFKELIREYRKSFLLFVYKAPDGSIWGQWDVLDRCNPKYQSEADKKTPAPDPSAFEDWKQQYRDFKASKMDEYLNLGVAVQPCSALEAKCLQISPSSAKIPAHIGISLGTSISSGVSTSKTSSTKAVEGGDADASNSASAELPTEPIPVDQQQSPPEVIDSRTQRSNGPQSAAASTKPKAANASAALSDQQDTWFDKEFWPKRWRPEGKQDALKAFRKVATTEKAKTEIMRALEEQRPEILSREQTKRPYMSTWLNSRRYEDQVELIAPIPVQPVSSAAGVSATPGDRRRAEILDLVGNG